MTSALDPGYGAPDHEMFAITMADGTTVERRADAIRAGIEATKTPTSGGTGPCKVCGKSLASGGMGPHLNAHKRLIGDAEPRPPKKKAGRPKGSKNAPKKEAPQPDPVEMPPLNETLSGVLFGYVGDTIPTSMIAEVGEWMAHTEALINALTKEQK